MNIRECIKKIPFAKEIYRSIFAHTPNRILFRRNIKKVEKFDAIHGTDFGGRLYQDEIGTSRDRANDYSPSPVSELTSILTKSNLTQRDKIADMGCGKGYAMYLMSKYNIGKVGGGWSFHSHFATKLVQI